VAAVLLFAAGPLVATHQTFAYGYGGFGHGGFGHGGHGGYGPSMAPCGGGPYSIVNGQIICTQMND
jgi:hypothetical protein